MKKLLVIIFLLFACSLYANTISSVNKKINQEVKEIKQEEMNEKQLISKYITTLRPRLKRNIGYVNNLSNLIYKYRKDVKSKLVVAIMYQESGFKTNAISGSDIGLMQVNAFYHCKNYKVSIEDLLNSETNVRIGCDILNNIIEQRKPQGYKFPYAFYNTGSLRIYDDKGNLIGGDSFIRHIERHLRKLEKVK